MKSLSLLAALFLSVIIAAPVAFAQPDLQDYGFNINGSSGTWDQLLAGDATGPALPTSSGLNLSGWDGVNTGLGTITFTTTTGGDFDFWILDPVSGPFYNEYGTTGGSAASGQSWQIDVPDYASDANHTGTIIANLENGTGALDDANNVPGDVSNYYQTCTSSATPNACNDAVSMAMGFNYSAPAAGFEDVITYTVSTTAPLTGFYLEEIQPIDSTDGGSNLTPSYLYLSGTITTEAIQTGAVPEPKTSILLGLAVLLLAVCFRRRFVNVPPAR